LILSPEENHNNSKIDHIDMQLKVFVLNSSTTAAVYHSCCVICLLNGQNSNDILSHRVAFVKDIHSMICMIEKPMSQSQENNKSYVPHGHFS